MSIYHDQLERHSIEYICMLKWDIQTSESADSLRDYQEVEKLKLPEQQKHTFNNYVDRVSVCQMWA